MQESCTIYQTVDFVSKKWTLLILLELYKTKGKKRYQALKNSLPDITPKILSSRLRELEHHGMITKIIDTTQFPVKCEYALTASGKDFIHIIKEIKKWGLQWNIVNPACERQDCKQCDL